MRLHGLVGWLVGWLVEKVFCRRGFTLKCDFVAGAGVGDEVQISCCKKHLALLTNTQFPRPPSTERGRIDGTQYLQKSHISTPVGA